LNKPHQVDRGVNGLPPQHSLLHAPSLDRFGGDLPILLAMDDNDTN
jgi:hypothetical protein